MLSQMYLVHTLTIALHESVGTNIPDYAILSHQWETEEVPYRNLRNGAADGLGAYSKVLRCCSQVAQDGWQYVWIDTYCIGKTSSAELSEAINSMFRWY